MVRTVTRGRKRAKETLQNTERAQLARDQNETSESAEVVPEEVEARIPGSGDWVILDAVEATTPSGGDDEAPDDVKLAATRCQALERKKNESEAVKRLKSSMKEKRRQKVELYKKQKETKQLKRLQAFPEKDLKEAVGKIAQMKGSEVKKKDDKEHRKSTSGRLRGANPSVAQVGRVKIVSTGGGRGVVEEKEEDYRQEQALQFLHHHFYGGQQKRVPVLSQRSRRYRDKPALNFTTSK